MSYFYLLVSYNPITSFRNTAGHHEDCGIATGDLKIFHRRSILTDHTRVLFDSA